MGRSNVGEFQASIRAWFKSTMVTMLHEREKSGKGERRSEERKGIKSGEESLGGGGRRRRKGREFEMVG